MEKCDLPDENTTIIIHISVNLDRELPVYPAISQPHRSYCSVVQSGPLLLDIRFVMLMTHVLKASVVSG